MNFEIPKDKLEFILEESSFLLKDRFFPVKHIASWTGKLQSLTLAIGPIVSIMCRAIYNIIKLAYSWFSSVSLDGSSKVEVTWWFNNLKYFSTYPIIIYNTTVKVDAKVSSDASCSGSQYNLR